MPELADRRRLEPAFDDVSSVKAACVGFREVFLRLRREIAKVIVGQDEVVTETLIAILADGHVLLEGVPGLGKTLLVRTLSETLTLPHARIQFTPDLMPADITGTTVVVDDRTTGRRSFQFREGPVFNQFILADEINRATPKTQAALLEAMQERSVSVAGRTHTLATPFFVLATQNPIEQEGTYPLPEAQLDRFIFKVIVPYADRKGLNEIVDRTTSGVHVRPEAVLDGPAIVSAQRLAQRIVIAPHVQDYAIRLILATHSDQGGDERLDRYIRVGVSPRGAQAIVSTAKVRALLAGRFAVAFKDLQAAAYPALRHRIRRSFEAQSEGVTTDEIIGHIIDNTPCDASVDAHPHDLES